MQILLNITYQYNIQIDKAFWQCSSSFNRTTAVANIHSRDSSF